MANVARYREYSGRHYGASWTLLSTGYFCGIEVGFAWACVVERLRLMDRGTPDIERASNRHGIDRQVCL